MKIILLITGLGMGGAEKIVCELADQLHNAGHEVGIIYFFGDIIKRTENDAISIQKVKLNTVFLVFKALFDLLKRIDQEKPDVIHSHMFHANIMARLIKFFRRDIRVICSSHSNYEGGKLRMKLYSLTENLCDVHTNVSDNASKKLMDAGAVKSKKIITVYNGINTNKYKFDENLREKVRKKFMLNDIDKVILTIGRIDTPKDYPTLLQAFKLVREKQDNIYLFIVGDGPKKSEIENLSKDLGIHQYIRFLGIRNDIPELLNACDLFISSSAWEGFGIAILEAMLCQRLIVSTQTDGAKELLDESLVEIGRYDSMSEMVLQVINGKNNKMFYPKAMNFDWKIILQKWLDIYKGNI